MSRLLSLVERDPLLRSVPARGRSSRLVPSARLELLAGIGHCPQVEAPERFTELVLEFSRLRAPAGA